MFWYKVDVEQIKESHFKMAFLVLAKQEFHMDSHETFKTCCHIWILIGLIPLTNLWRSDLACLFAYSVIGCCVIALFYWGRSNSNSNIGQVSMFELAKAKLALFLTCILSLSFHYLLCPNLLFFRKLKKHYTFKRFETVLSKLTSIY